MPSRSSAARRPGFPRAASLLLAALLAGPAAAQGTPDAAAATKPTFKIYGFAQLDVIGDFKRVAPDWRDTLRPTKIPTVPEEFGPNGETSLSVKQTRFGVWGEI